MFVWKKIYTDISCLHILWQTLIALDVIFLKFKLKPMLMSKNTETTVTQVTVVETAVHMSPHGMYRNEINTAQHHQFLFYQA